MFYSELIAVADAEGFDHRLGLTSSVSDTSHNLFNEVLRISVI